jgi:hypothetical protein
MGENRSRPCVTALYGVVLLLTALAYVVLERAIVAQQGKAA